jgi:hypothetical protein
MPVFLTHIVERGSARESCVEKMDMNKFWLATATAFALMTGAAVAQTTATTTTTETTVPVPVVPPAVVHSTHERTVDANGVTEHSRTVTTTPQIGPYGDTTTTTRTTETTETTTTR